MAVLRRSDRTTWGEQDDQLASCEFELRPSRSDTNVALDDVDSTVAPGEVFGFVGSNGAGKMTTMRIMLAVLAADAGQVHLKDRLIDLDLRRRVGYMPEERVTVPNRPQQPDA